MSVFCKPDDTEKYSRTNSTGIAHFLRQTLLLVTLAPQSGTQPFRNEPNESDKTSSMLKQTFIIIYFFGLIISNGTRISYTKSSRHNQIHANRKSGIDTLLIILSGLSMTVLPVIYAATSWLNFADYALSDNWRITLGLGGTSILAGVIWLLRQSHLELGRNWTPTLQLREAHQLVTSGIYSLVRHPMYAAYWGWALAQAMLLQNLIVGFSMLIIFLPTYFYRIPHEEQMMQDYFGEVYQEYMKRTGRIFPRWNKIN